MAKENVRHSKTKKFCLLYEELESENVTDILLKHKELIPIQRSEYHKQKQNIGNGTTSTTALVTQDFTQIQFDGGFVQDLIICIYSKESEKDGLNRVYRHFVGKSQDKNDISFVVGAYGRFYWKRRYFKT